MSSDLIPVKVNAGILPDLALDDLTDNQAYRQLYVSIIQLAIKDYEFLRRIDGRIALSPSERKKLRGLSEDSDPVEFFNSPWFVDICGMIGVHPQAIREHLEVHEGMDLMPISV